MVVARASAGGFQPEDSVGVDTDITTSKLAGKFSRYGVWGNKSSEDSHSAVGVLCRVCRCYGLVHYKEKGSGVYEILIERWQ
ncbi:unnamed protein product [Linum tenue]|uniref:Uncharacterized protein n=1 Tax=Linum tenue TaxID=586396 RepID=A0AAV0L9F0_9ROSI|nr:unnamed protein product [Linum tenue]